MITECATPLFENTAPFWKVFLIGVLGLSVGWWQGRKHGGRQVTP